MIIYNVTINVDHNEVDNWLDYMQNKHIQDVLDTGCFIEARLSRVQAEEEGGKTYSVQYLCESQAKLEEYQNQHAPVLQAEHTQKFAGKFAAFRTLLDIVEIKK